MIAIYARQSIDKKDSISIDSQIEICKKEIGDNPYSTYIDKGFSGKNTQRPEFNRMMADIKAGKIKKIIVYRLDRISRAILDFAKMMAEFDKYKVEFVSTTEKFDTSSPMGKAMLSIVMIFAQLERETIQQRIKDNYYARGSKGFFLGGKTPYGYDKQSTKIEGIKTSVLTPLALEVDNVYEMFEEYAKDGTSLGSVSKRLNIENIPAPFGGKWESTKVARILKNPVYVKADADVYLYYKNKGCEISNDLADFVGEYGCYLYGKRDRSAAKFTDVTDHVLSLSIHEGLIPSDIFLACQYKLDSNKQIKNSGKGKYTWLTGLTKCGYCSYAMTVTTFKHYKYLSCRGKTSYNACEGQKETVYLEDVEDHVYNQIVEKCEFLRNNNTSFTQKENFIDNSYKIKLINIEEQINKLVDSLATSNDVVIDYINKKITDLHNKKMEIIAKHTKVKKTDSEIDFKDIISKVDSWEKITFDEKKAVAQSLIKKVNISDDNINIKWRY